LAKDLQDEPGDRAQGRRTLPVRLGRAGAARIAWWCCLAFVPLSIALPLVASYGAVYFGVALAAQLLVLAAGRGLLRERFAQSSRLLKLAMVIGLAALVAGRIA
ncbi:MAG TPA: UbiA family prenyltransferase, partial [Gemmatimonadales bacterium]